MFHGENIEIYVVQHSYIRGILASPELERAVAKRIIAQLEDRLALYNASEMEVADYCIMFVVDIRRMPLQELDTLEKNLTLVMSLRAMRTACRKFLDSVQSDNRIIRFGSRLGHFASWEFNGAVGDLRGVFSVHLAQIATQYGFDIEDELTSILLAVEESMKHIIPSSKPQKATRLIEKAVENYECKRKEN